MKTTKFEQGRLAGREEMKMLHSTEIFNLKEDNKKLIKRLDDKDRDAQIRILEAMAHIAEAVSRALLGYNKQL